MTCATEPFVVQSSLLTSSRTHLVDDESLHPLTVVGGLRDASMAHIVVECTEGAHPRVAQHRHDAQAREGRLQPHRCTRLTQVERAALEGAPARGFA
eukprot:6510891-Prymnesium_polylepis.2